MQITERGMVIWLRCRRSAELGLEVARKARREEQARGVLVIPCQRTIGTLPLERVFRM